MRKLANWCLPALIWVLLVGGAAAQESNNVVVLPFEGRGGAGVRSHVVSALQKSGDVQLVPSSDAQAAAERLGTPLDSPTGYQAVGQELNVAAFVVGEVTRKGPNTVATVRVIDASTGEVAGEEPWSRRKPAQLKAMRGNFWKALGPAVLGCSVPAAPTPEPEPEPESEPEPVAEAEVEPEAAPRKLGKRKALEVDVLGGAMWRDLSYRDADANIRTYSNDLFGAAFIGGIEAEWYPGAHFTDSRAGDIGLDLDFDMAFGLKSKDTDPGSPGGSNVKTTAWDMRVGAVFRLPVDVFVPKLRAAYVRQVFEVDYDPDQVFLPAVDYSALRFGIGSSVQLHDMFALELDVAYLYVLDAGQINSDRYFPNGRAGAVDVDSDAIVTFNEWVAAVVGVDWRRYGHDFRYDPSFVQVGGAKRAGGAKDRYVKLNLGVRITWSPG